MAGRIVGELDQAADVAVGIDHHIPGQVCDLSGPQACLRRQQDHDRVAQRVPGATGEGEQIADVRYGQYFSALCGHYAVRCLDMLKYTTATQFEQTRTTIT